MSVLGKIFKSNKFLEYKTHFNFLTGDKMHVNCACIFAIVRYEED
jgi:hypothetical protein